MPRLSIYDEVLSEFPATLMTDIRSFYRNSPLMAGIDIHFFNGDLFTQEEMERTAKRVANNPAVLIEVGLLESTEMDSTLTASNDALSISFYSCVSYTQDPELSPILSLGIANRVRQVAKDYKWEYANDASEGHLIPTTIDKELSVPDLSVHNTIFIFENTVGL